MKLVCTGGLGVAFVANDTQNECNDVAAQLPPQQHSGARCPMRPPGVEEIVDAVIMSAPDVSDRDFRTLPNSL